MAIKKFLLKEIYFIALMLAATSAVYAQSAAQLPAQSAAQDAGQRITQRFSWSGGEYTLRYEVVFERIENGVNIFHFREFTANNFIEAALPPGEYRFRVIPYDILDRPARGTEWKYIEILRMPAPETETGTLIEIAEAPPEPESGTGAAAGLKPEQTKRSRYEVVDESMTWEEARLEAQRRGGYLATITSEEEQKNVFDLVKKGKKNFYWLGGHCVNGQWEWISGEPFVYSNWGPGQPDNHQNVQDKLMIMRLSYKGINNSKAGHWDDESNSRVLRNELNKTGFIIEYPLDDYSFYELEEKAEAEHEAEPETEPEPKISIWEYFEELGDMVVSFGVPVSMLIPYYGYEFDDCFSLIGFGMSMRFMRQTPLNLYIGPEILLFLNMAEQNVSLAGANLIAMKWMPGERTAVAAKFGVLYPVMFNGEPQTIVDVGASFHFRLFNNVVMEAGFDFLHIFNDVSSGCFRPWAGLSFHF